jgi:transcription initiation factor TFIIB
MKESVEKLTKYCRELGLDDAVLKYATRILELGMQLRDEKYRKCPHCGRMSGRIRDDSIISASIYVASIFNGERRTQRNIADVCGVNEVTLRVTGQKIIKLVGIEKIDKDIPTVFAIEHR